MPYQRVLSWWITKCSRPSVVGFDVPITGGDGSEWHSIALAAPLHAVSLFAAQRFIAPLLASSHYADVHVAAILNSMYSSGGNCTYVCFHLCESCLVCARKWFTAEAKFSSHCPYALDRRGNVIASSIEVWPLLVAPNTQACVDDKVVYM